MQLLVLKAQERSDDTKRVLQSVEEDCRAWIPRIKEMLNLNYETRLSQINKSWEDLYNSLKEELDDSRTSVQENYNKYQQAATERDHFNHQLEGIHNTAASTSNSLQICIYHRVKVSARGIGKRNSEC